MKVAIIGSNGQLGTDIVRAFGDSIVIPLSHDDIEISEINSVHRVFRKIHPDLVINTASFVNVEGCEKDPEKSYRINETGALNLARVLAGRNIDLLHISTDYVFDGSKRLPYEETDPPNPLNVYGSSKLAGEKAIQENALRYYIVRTSGLYGHSVCRGKGSNFIEKIIDLSGKKSELTVVNDEILTPTYTFPLAYQIRALVQTKEYGLYHATNNGSCSWFEFAVDALRLAGIKIPVVPVSSTVFPSTVKRPQYSVLNNSKLGRMGLDRMPEWKQSLAEYFSGKNNRP
jgi:dTDP-4-dehydrorhamnose reductase